MVLGMCGECDYDELFPVQENVSVTSDFGDAFNPETIHFPTPQTDIQNLNKVWKYWANLTYMVGQFSSFDKYK